MKWKTNSKLALGSIRYRKKFAWLPVVCDFDGEVYTVWLETYRVKEEYRKVTRATQIGTIDVGAWVVTERIVLFWEFDAV